MELNEIVTTANLASKGFFYIRVDVGMAFQPPFGLSAQATVEILNQDWP